MRRFSSIFLFVCIIALVVMTIWAPKSEAFDTYSGMGTTCVTCHGPFSANPYISPSDGSNWGDSLHEVHRRDMLSFDCNTCHLIVFGPPVFLNSSNGGSDLDPISCVGCHGRKEDRSIPNVAEGDGAGLRQHHWNEGITACRICHSEDTEPDVFTPAGENILPTYYANPGTGHPNMPTNPCNPNGEEDYAGTTIGLDNDGDLLYDVNDPDCSLPPECTVDADCDDGVTCTDDTCVDGVCVFTANDANCDNGVFCDGAETCDAINDCQAGTPPSCDDGVGCTDDSCDAGSDACLNVPNDGNCDDGLFCNGLETCDQQLDCQAGTPACDPLTEDCIEGDPPTCVPKPECTVDADCDDGLFCNGAETCDAASGTCQPGTPVDCDDGVDCTEDTCDEVNDTCVNTPDDTACPDDGLFCTGEEICDPAAGCVSTGDPCEPDETCNEDTGACDQVDDKVTLCHKGKKTITVNATAVPAHLRHGDTLGPCP